MGVNASRVIIFDLRFLLKLCILGTADSGDVQLECENDGSAAWMLSRDAQCYSTYVDSLKSSIPRFWTSPVSIGHPERLQAPPQLPRQATMLTLPHIRRFFIEFRIALALDKKATAQTVGPESRCAVLSDGQT